MGAPKGECGDGSHHYRLFASATDFMFGCIGELLIRQSVVRSDDARFTPSDETFDSIHLEQGVYIER